MFASDMLHWKLQNLWLIGSTVFIEVLATTNFMAATKQYDYYVLLRDC